MKTNDAVTPYNIYIASNYSYPKFPPTRGENQFSPDYQVWGAEGRGTVVVVLVKFVDVSEPEVGTVAEVTLSVFSTITATLRSTSEQTIHSRPAEVR